ncbi:MAG: HAD family hydrolase [Rhodobacterales bacterium]|nr:MAG: HAD family hydrolase [Rhodobacterales bacterium]
MSQLKLAIFDVDGTLADSQGEIMAAMARAFESQGLTPPARDDILSIVGLSLEQAMPRLLPNGDARQHAALADAYRQAYFELRQSNGVSPLYPGALACLQTLSRDPWTLLGIATGKSKRGLDALLAGHGIEPLFVTRQVADFHPSKPDPSMIRACLDETGVAAEHAVMIGDTSFDMDMARNAGVAGIGVSWGYHPRSAFGQGARLVESFDALCGALTDIWGTKT